MLMSLEAWDERVKDDLFRAFERALESVNSTGALCSRQVLTTPESGYQVYVAVVSPRGKLEDFI